MRQRPILLGNEKKTGDGVYIDPKTRSTHMQVIGSTGEGKSFFLEHMIREDILNHDGLCLIDPHGALYDKVVNWCEIKHLLDEKNIILFDPAEDGWVFGFNPLKVTSPVTSFHVNAMVQACAKVWGGEDTDKTPLLKKCLGVIFHILIEKKLSLIEAKHLLDPTDIELRQHITKNIQNDAIRRQWAYFESLNLKQFYEMFGSATNRMMSFLTSPIIEKVVGQTENTIDFRKIMDEGKILLVNLSPRNKVSDDDARLLATLIINDLFLNARERPEGSRPFYLYVDECGLFINKDFARILDEGRKFGLHLILSHQHLSHIKNAGEDVFNSVITDAKTKVIFGGLGPDDAEYLARMAFLGEIDLEEPKKSLNKPVAIDYEKIILNNESYSTSNATGESYSRSISNSESESLSANDEIKSSSSGSSYSDIDGHSRSFTEGETKGYSEALRPIFKNMPTQVYSLEEQIYKAMNLMVNQTTQHAIVKLPKQKTKFIKTPTINPGFANDKRVKRFKEGCYKLADFVKTEQEAQLCLEKRILALTQATSSGLLLAKGDPAGFRDSTKPRLKG